MASTSKQRFNIRVSWGSLIRNQLKVTFLQSNILTAMKYDIYRWKHESFAYTDLDETSFFYGGNSMHLFLKSAIPLSLLSLIESSLVYFSHAVASPLSQSLTFRIRMVRVTSRWVLSIAVAYEWEQLSTVRRTNLASTSNSIQQPRGGEYTPYITSRRGPCPVDNIASQLTQFTSYLKERASKAKAVQ